jgi:hypothetical protein
MPRAVFLKLSTIADHFIKFNTPEGTCKWENIVPVVKVTITTFFLCTNLKYFLK